jgi:sirohydrochlorin cobaltochelatase
MTPDDSRAPMASAPMAYNDDGSVAWGDMWDSFCALAAEGGPPHRGTLLRAPRDADPAHPNYAVVVAEITRGIAETSGLDAAAAEPGWIAVDCTGATMATWLANAIVEENVEAQARDRVVLVPTGEHFTLKGEIKNVITAVAKTTHYWDEHLAAETKLLYTLEDRIGRVRARLHSLMPRREGG